ncbi:epididymal secretory protein E3-beta [Tupaia chinensis]|uniref:epididymal secretory protein E3-beta n=1 Tax=Tupaia chinensis TaxID=246437 RepID=UPI0003C8DE07|nr:epididymal secretory protein E3-beta [Tupaia chinensis]
MASFLKIWGIILAFSFLLCRLVVYNKDISWREFMKQHHLSPSKTFSSYKCDDLMREREALRDKESHVFIYASWHKIDRVCYSQNGKDRYGNVYVWVEQPFKILKCQKETSKNSYIETRSYNHIQFHCSMDGYVDRIEDINVLEPLDK